MEKRRPDKSSDGPNSKRRKMETNGSTSSTKPKVKKDCPISMLPPDIVAKIIAYVPIIDWPSLELTDKKICRPATLIAWRQLRRVNVERDCMIKPEKKRPHESFDSDEEECATNSTTSYGKVVIAVKSILQQLADRSPFLSSLNGLDIRLGNARANSDVINLLASFEHLQSLSLGDAEFFIDKRAIPLESIIELLESTRSRSSLKEVRLFNIARGRNRATLIDEFASSFASGREIRSQLKLEKFEFTSVDRSLFIRLDTMDTTRLIDLRLGGVSIEPQELTHLIERASNLSRIELSFMKCSATCKSPRLQANKKLLTALASCEHLTTIKFDCIWSWNDDVNCMNLGLDFIEMLKSIGRHGKLKKLAIKEHFARSSVIEMKDICTTICTHIPYLRSIELYVVGNVGSVSVCKTVANMTDLEEIHLNGLDIPMAGTAMKKISRLPNLKRLAMGNIVDTESLKYLTSSSKLKDLRINFAGWISADILERWSDGFASNLKSLKLYGIPEEDIQAERGLIRVLEKTVRLRVLYLEGGITKRTFKAIATSCPKLEVLRVRPGWGEKIKARHVQQILDRCPKLRKFAGF